MGSILAKWSAKTKELMVEWIQILAILLAFGIVSLVNYLVRLGKLLAKRLVLPFMSILIIVCGVYFFPLTVFYFLYPELFEDYFYWNQVEVFVKEFSILLIPILVLACIIMVRRTYLWIKRHKTFEVIAALAGAFASVFAYVQISVSTNAHHEQSFQMAIESLNSEENNKPFISSRVGALLSLKGLVEKDPEKFSKPISEVVCAYFQSRSEVGPAAEDINIARGMADGSCPEYSRSGFAVRDLRGADFRGYKGDNVVLKNADLRGATFGGQHPVDRAELPRVDLRGANMRHVHMQGAEMPEAMMEGADLRDAFLLNAKLQGANLKDVKLAGADLRGANLTNLQGWTWEQLRQAYVDTGTTFPDSKRRTCEQLFEMEMPVHRNDDSCLKLMDWRRRYKRVDLTFVL